MKGTLRPGRKAGVLALAVLLLTCVLMAGAVSADRTETVSDYNELVANLSDIGVTKIILGSNIETSKEISVNRSVTIDGQYHTISVKSKSSPEWSQSTGEKNLLVIETGMSDAPVVTLENIFFECYGNATAGDLWYADSSNREALKPYMGAHGIQVYDTGTTQMQLKNIKINGSQGSGIHVNGANVSLVNVTVTNSVWQSVDVGKGVDVTNAATLTIDGDTELLDDVQINVDNPTQDVTVKFLDDTSYKQYSFHYNDEGYGEKKWVWSTDVNAAAEKIAESKKVTFNATVQNTGDDPLAYHADFSKAMDAAEDGATVTQLQKLTLTEPITIDKAITFDGNEKTITAEGNTLTVVAGITGLVTIKNVDATISTSATNPDLDSPIKIMSPVVMENNRFDITDFNNVRGDTVAVILAVGAEESTLKGTQITMGSADNTGVQGIAVYGNEVTISGSTITAAALQDGGKSTGIYTSGVGDITITDNTFVSEAENGAGNRGIMVWNPTADAGQSIIITDNTFDLAAGAGDTAGAVVAVSSKDDSQYTVNLDVTKNTVTAAARGVYLVSDVTVTGDVAGNDFRAIPEESRIAIAEGVDPNMENLHTGNNDAPVDPQPVSGSSSGNMNNAYRVLFNDGSTTLSVQTDLSSGDKLTEPATPVKDGYTFAGWYKDSACTQGWDFETGISGDMTLYAKWTAAGSSGETEATATPTKTQTAVTTPQPTKTQTAAATTSAPQATTAAGVSPTLTQAPAPVAGALFGLLAAGVLLRRRFQ